MMRRCVLALVVLSAWLFAVPVSAGITITFWSHDQDRDFPHAFFTLTGTPDAGGAALDESHGFTAKTITPAILLGPVAGKVEPVTRGYMRRSDAQFSAPLSDAQLVDVEALVAAWRVDTKYSLNKRNCIHFVAEALRRAGLTVPELPRLMKKPKSFLHAVALVNERRITVLNLPGAAYLAAREDQRTASSTEARIVPADGVR